MVSRKRRNDGCHQRRKDQWVGCTPLYRLQPILRVSQKHLEKYGCALVVKRRAVGRSSVRIVWIRSMVVCGACGHENQGGDSSCVTCGTPLSHGNGNPPETLGSKSLSSEGQHSATLTRPGMVPEIPLEEYVKSFRYAPPSDPTEITMRGDAQVLQPRASSLTDTPPGAPPETSTVVEVKPISAAGVNLHEQPPKQLDDVTTTRKTTLHSERFDQAVAPTAIPPEPIPAVVTDVPWSDVLEDFIIAVALGVTTVLLFAGLVR